MVTNSPLQTSVVVVTSTGFELSPFITTSKDAGWFKTFTVTERVVEQLGGCPGGGGVTTGAVEAKLPGVDGWLGESRRLRLPRDIFQAPL